MKLWSRLMRGSVSFLLLALLSLLQPVFVTVGGALGTDTSSNHLSSNREVRQTH